MPIGLPGSESKPGYQVLVVEPTVERRCLTEGQDPSEIVEKVGAALAKVEPVLVTFTPDTTRLPH